MTCFYNTIKHDVTNCLSQRRTWTSNSYSIFDVNYT